MRVIDNEKLNEGNCKITFIRIDPEDKKETLKNIFENIESLGWINEKIPEYLRPSYIAKAEPTISKLEELLEKRKNDELTSEIGEYFVSEISRETIINELKYKDIPLSEIWKEKVSGNPGFDYHSQNNEHIIIFGEAKYLSNKNAYKNALKQIVEFIDLEKDIKELSELNEFVSKESIVNANRGKKGYAIGFSVQKTKTKNLINHIKKDECFNMLKQYEEIVIVAVNVYG